MKNARHIREQAEMHATERVESIPELQSGIFEGLRSVWWSSLRAAFIKGADAGYAAAKDEERKP